jgi:hypothetical protein
MTGMSDNQHNLTTDVSQNSDEIVGTYVVPARLLDKYRAQFQDKEFTIDSLILFKDLRRCQKGRGPEQTLIVWKTHDIPLKEVIICLDELTAPLSYK